MAFEFSDRAEWLRLICHDMEMVETPGTGHEWEFTLDRRAGPADLPEGFTLWSLASDPTTDRAAIAECIRSAFVSEYDVEAVLRSLERNPMFRPELSVFVRSPDGLIASYCRGTVDPENGVCGIDPVCTSPQFGRLGLGAAVVSACFAAQRELGGRRSYIGSGPEPEPGTHLYRSLGPSDRTTYCRWSTT